MSRAHKSQSQRSAERYTREKAVCHLALIIQYREQQQIKTGKSPGSPEFGVSTAELVKHLEAIDVPRMTTCRLLEELVLVQVLDRSHTWIPTDTGAYKLYFYTLHAKIDEWILGWNDRRNAAMKGRQT